MTQTPEYPDSTVRALIDRLFEGDEPPHRPGMADASIAHGASATRRRGYAVVGVSLSVLVVAAGAVAFSGGASRGNDWSVKPEPGTTGTASYEDSQPTYSDKQREIFGELPGLLTPLLPPGMALVRDPTRFGPMSASTGDFSPEFKLRSSTGEYYLQVNADEATFARTLSAVPVAVAGGSVRVQTVPRSDGSGGSMFDTYLEYTPADGSKTPIRLLVYGSGNSGPLDTAAFVKIVNAPGFQAVATLLDPAVPASAAAVRQRFQIEDRINAETTGVLPPGFQLKLSPAIPAGLELVGPSGVNIFEWAIPQGTNNAAACPAGTLCYSDGNGGKFNPVALDGRPRLGTYGYVLGDGSGKTVYVTISGKPALGMSTAPEAIGKPSSESAPLGRGLTPQQARAIMQAPGLVKAIDDVNKVANP